LPAGRQDFAGCLAGLWRERETGVGGLIFLDPFAMLLVFGGAGAMAALRSTRADLARAVKALGPLVRTRVEAEAQASRVAVNRIAERTQASGLATADRAAVVERYIARAARQLSDTREPEAFTAWAEADLAARAERHAAVHAVWRAAADAAPAMGMIGTVIGLIRMFSALEDPSAIGPGMALALLTTLYGVIAANCIAGPITARLERLSRAELLWQKVASERLAALAHEELETPIADRVARIEARLRAVA
jgi:chemotaxis protein MotA